MKEGFYEQILTDALAAHLARLPEARVLREPMAVDDAVMLLQRLLQPVLRQSLQGLSEQEGEEAGAAMVRLVNRIIDLLAAETGEPALLAERILLPGELLKAWFRAGTYEHADIREHVRAVFPITGLSAAELFTGSRAGISLHGELRREMLTADEVWWLVSFLKFEGVRLFETAFADLQRRRIPVRIICTVYMGATDLKAIDFLSQFDNIRLRISYNIRHERLHAKSYLFRRHTGFHTAYIGSSNLSRSALTDGLEWNLKVTSREIPHIIEKCAHTFETYWHDADFSDYDPSADRDRLAAALRQGSGAATAVSGTEAFFDIRPYPFQQEMLDALAAQRARGLGRNLLVAATGTGKTVIAAFDFRRYRAAHPRARLLFVAHREEILRQARATFRQVLRDADFGRLWYGGQQPDTYHQLFVTVQTLNGRIGEMALSEDFFDFIIIDEVHHIAAPSYRRVIERFRPSILLGLTATPERHDGSDITADFGHAVSAELRLPEALNNGLLCPFQYFGVHDGTDISRVSWRRGRYDTAELERVYTEDTRRADEVLRNCRKYLRDPDDTRAVGFCVSRRHAAFMAERFRARGMRAEALTSDQADEREAILQRFRRKETHYLFVVDMLNEGVDIPGIDTILFLRPTESMTVFLQQLGRGLRKEDGKALLTVLDFIGNARVEYSFEHRFRALLGRTHTRIRDEIRNDFPHLPLGCAIQLDQSAREHILRNLERHFRGGKEKLLERIRQFRLDHDVEPNLGEFLRLTGVSLASIYAHDLLWCELLASSVGQASENDERHRKIARCMGTTWLSTASTSYFVFLRQCLGHGFPRSEDVEARQWMLMCYVDLFGEPPKVADGPALADLLEGVFWDPRLREELSEYLDLRIESINIPEGGNPMPFETALRVHGRYSRAQVMVGLGLSDLGRLHPSREGVLFCEALHTEAFFVTLDKSEGGFNPTTMYDDYFINGELFHWQSQNATAPETPKGRSYIEHIRMGKRILLFVRESKRDEHGLTMGFVCCGFLTYVAHEGARPMSITWRMVTPPPSMLLQEGRKLAIG
jgi:superfamily II DNA or RNA helicase